MYGYSGKILHIDLTERKTWVEDKTEDWYKMWIGGVSMATRLCWENITPGCDPYSPENPICFANGIFAGTPVPVYRTPGSGRRQELLLLPRWRR